MGTRRKRTKLTVREKLLKALREVNRPTRVHTAGDRPLTMPGLEVDGLGAVRLPLGKTQARKLIRLCRQAPYGKGTETLVDTDVRRVWELDPEQFRLANPRWRDLVESIVSEAQQELGLENRKLSAHLYKLLVYEEGSFFLPHRDGEKLDRMVATMVICLPAVHEGGELIVSHDGQQHEVAFTGAASGHELSFTAFYADCQHEVRPIRSGHRLCLTYNVTLAKSRSKKGIAAPSFGTAAAAIGDLLSDWPQVVDSEKIAIALDHRYTQGGLTMATLKGIDRARAEVLFDAAEHADCMAYLALVTLWQHGSAEGGWGHGYRWSNHDDDGDVEDDTASEYVMGEIFDHGLSANHWSDRQGSRVRLGEIPLNEDEIFSDSPFEDWDPDREDFEDYTGNAGMTLERWYHRAAIVIWPRRKHFAVLCGAGTNASIGGLAPMVRRLGRTAKARRDEKRRECLSFAGAIIDSWDPGTSRRLSDSSGQTDVVGPDVFPALLCELNDPDLIHRFLSQVMVGDGDAQVDKSFAKVCKQHGWASFERDLAAVFQATTALTVARNAKLLRTICMQRDKNAARIKTCTRLSERAVKALVGFDKQPPDNDWRARRVDRAELLSSLVTAMLAIDAVNPLMRLIHHALGCTKYDLTDSHLAAIFALESRLAKLPRPDPAVSLWVNSCRQQLEDRIVQAPQEPTNYRRPHALSCNCRDCKELSRFLEDPDQGEHRFAMAKERRRHLHQIIDSNRCDLTHTTERRGRPFTLVCTKTTASYEAACEVYLRDLHNLSRIIELDKKCP